MNILLISKYSQHCHKLLEFLKTNNLIQALHLNIICIDNENIRKRIKNSEIDIKNVPCLLSIVDKIRVEKFEGDELNKWISFHYGQVMQQHQQMMQQQQQQQIMQQQHQQIPQQQIRNQPPQNIVVKKPIINPPEPFQEEEEEEENEPEKLSNENTSTEKFAKSQMLAQQQLKIEQLQMKPVNILEGGTAIDDLLDEEENEGILEELSESNVQEIIGKKQKKKKDKYNSSLNDYNEYETKNKKKEQKKLDLLNAAMLMKKSREAEDKSINKSFT